MTTCWLVLGVLLFHVCIRNLQQSISYLNKFRSCQTFCSEQFDIMFDELMESTRKLIKATSKELDKWRRM